MTKDLVCLYDNNDIATAVDQMIQYRVRRLVVLNHKEKDSGDIYGILSLDDIAQYASDDQLAMKAWRGIMNNYMN